MKFMLCPGRPITNHVNYKEIDHLPLKIRENKSVQDLTF